MDRMMQNKSDNPNSAADGTQANNVEDVEGKIIFDSSVVLNGDSYSESDEQMVHSLPEPFSHR